MYMAFKHSHMGLAVVSFCLFVLRYGWMLAGSEQLQKKWVKILPHVVDTALLLCAFGLMWVLQQYPIQQPWLTAKVVALVAYIGLGTMALKRGKTRGQRALYGALAILTFAYIAKVALTKVPWPWLW